ncbi:sterol desaturase family protein [Halioxenophilus sp. WMMB6]|uniref:sterol desaturase family protein n=1 Tax=Halioxenophilus sp. WMMB6 TaxID=3073815 RepID=UPI00295F219B|nr:sterol desaturase family protein [Halioxenophilus sp. WMMB6]
MAILLTVLLAEWLAGRHKGLYGKNDYLVNGLCALLGFTIRPLLALSVALFIGAVVPVAQGSFSDWPFWPSLIAILVLADFCMYWLHRWSHINRQNPVFNWIWKLHRTHHTAKYVNVLLHFRINLFWGMVTPVTWVHSLAFYLGLQEPAIVSILIFSIWGIFTHSHFRWDDTLRRHQWLGKPFRALEHIIVSPGIHHTHHGYGRDGKHYRNFGLVLSVFDWLFGSLHIPEGRPQNYGLAERRPHWAEEVFYPVYQEKFSRYLATAKDSA